MKIEPADGAVCAAAIKQVKMKPAVGELTQAALLRNLDITRKLGCLDSAGLDEMRHGKAATIRKEPHNGTSTTKPVRQTAENTSD